MKRTFLILLSFLVVTNIASINAQPQGISVAINPYIVLFAAGTCALGIYTGVKALYKGAKTGYNSIKDSYPNRVALIEKYANSNTLAKVATEAKKLAACTVGALGGSIFAIYGLSILNITKRQNYLPKDFCNNPIIFDLITSAACLYTAFRFGTLAANTVSTKVKS